MVISCRRCGYTSASESEIELHHIIPKSLGGTDRDGRTYLCKKYHSIWHNMIPMFIFRFVTGVDKQQCLNQLKLDFEWFVRNRK